MFACLHAPGNLAVLVECARHFSPLIEETSPDTVVFDVRGLQLIFGAQEHIAAERTGHGGVLNRDQKDAAAAFPYARIAEERTGHGGVLNRDQKDAAAAFRCARIAAERTGHGGVLNRDQKDAAAAFPYARIAAEIHAQVGLPANIALASNPDAAVHAALGFKGTTVIPAGQEAAILASLPVYLLGGSPEFAATLNTWGIRTFGEFAALPPLGVAARLGDEGVHFQRLARGEGRRLLRLRGEPLEFQEDLEPETPVELLEPLLFLFSLMLNNLCERLRSHSLAANEIRLLLKLERAPNHAVTLRLPVPMLDAKVFLKLLHLELSDRPPQAAVDRISLTLMPVQPRATQHGLFLPSSPEPEKLEITLARIRSLVGAPNIGAPEPLDTYRPDRFQMRSLALSKPPALAAAAAPKLALRRFRPPCPAQVWCAAGDQPAKLSSPKGAGRVSACSGPWRTSGDWWTADPWDRLEWDVEISNLGLFRIYRDCQTGQWHIEGSYD